MAVPAMSPHSANPFTRETLSSDVLNEWQRLIDSAAAMFQVPAGLITRVDRNQIEILLTSKTAGNPYPAGCTAPYPDSGWYCEHTLKSRGLNLIPDAQQDPQWRTNSAVTGFHMVSYVGMPILRPDGKEFGTVCFLDNKANAHNELHIQMLGLFARMIELSLRVIFDKERYEQQERMFSGLSKIYPICSYCKKIREPNGTWTSIESYIQKTSGAKASHGICPSCMRKVETQLGMCKHAK